MPVYQRYRTENRPGNRYGGKFAFSLNGEDDPGDYNVIVSRNDGVADEFSTKGAVNKLIEGDLNWATKYLDSERVTSSPLGSRRSQTPSRQDDDDDDDCTYLQSGARAGRRAQMFQMPTQVNGTTISHLMPKKRFSISGPSPTPRSYAELPPRSRYSYSENYPRSRFSYAESSPQSRISNTEDFLRTKGSYTESSPRSRFSYNEGSPGSRLSCAGELSSGLSNGFSRHETFEPKINANVRAVSTPPSAYREFNGLTKVTPPSSTHSDFNVQMNGVSSFSLPPSGYNRQKLLSQKPEMSDTRRKIRRLICESKKNPHYFDD